MKNRTFLCIDLKSFYASVECIERGLDPMTTNLVVADVSRTEKTICLAVSPALKSYGIPGRARLFEVVKKVKQANSSRLQKHIAPEDIHVYSIDEVFIDLTTYLGSSGLTPHDFAMKMIRDVYQTTGITATAGIGTNMYLAKIAMDIVAKHIPADKEGVRIAELDEMSYRQQLWNHRPLTDFWRVGRGYAKKLEENGMFTMGEIYYINFLG